MIQENSGDPPSWWKGFWNGFANAFTAAKMTAGWVLGVGSYTRVFMNDRVADAMRNSSYLARGTVR